MEEINLDFPLISICIPAYNCAAYISETIACLLGQTYQSIEIIVVNDGSTDDTSTIANSAGDTRVSVIDVTNGGASKARNIAYKHAKGAYIIFFDADDYVDANFIQTQLNRFNGADDVVVMADWGRFYGSDKAKIYRENIPNDEILFEDWIYRYWYNCNPMTNPGRTMIPKQIVEQAGLWNENLSLNDDLEFFTRVMLKAKKIILNHDAVFYYRSGIAGLSAKQGTEASLSLYNSILMATTAVLNRYPNAMLVKQSCANMWQSFIYITYPHENQLIKIAEQHITGLAKPDLKFHAGGITKFLIGLLGWKAVKKIKLFIR